MSHAPDTVNAAFQIDETAEAKGWRARITKLAAASGSPKRTAAGFALGVFLSFSPFFGFQIIVGVGTALALRLSKAAVLLGLCANLPWLIVPWYTLTTAAGALVLRVPIPPGFSAQIRQLLDLPVYRAAFWQHAVDLAGPFLWCFIIGSTAGALLMGAAAYVAASAILAPAQAARRES